MTGNQPKLAPAETLQAQAAAFFAENLFNDGSAHTMPQRLADLALGVTTDLVLPPEHQRRMEEFLEEKGPDYAPIKQREELLVAYGDFEPEIDTLLEDLAGTDTAGRREHPRFLGEGYSRQVFAVEYEGHPYAVRVPRPDKPDDENKLLGGVDKGYVRSGLKTRGLAHVEQLVAVSYATGITVTELMPGSSLRKLGSEDIADITDEQLQTLIHTLTAVQQAGLGIDPKPSNFFYDRDEGFGVIDLNDLEPNPEITRADWLKAEDLAAIISTVATNVLINTGLEDETKEPESSEEYEHRSRMLDALIPVLERYRVLCGDNFSGDILEQIEKRIDRGVKKARLTRQAYNDPDWVREQLAGSTSR